jgi:hypothetical protein
MGTLFLMLVTISAHQLNKSPVTYEFQLLEAFRSAILEIIFDSELVKNGVLL